MSKEVHEAPERRGFSPALPDTGLSSLLICCSAFRCDLSQFPNLTIKKIPKAVLKKCEGGHDDYSLEIQDLPKAPPEPEEQTEAKPAKPRGKFGKGNPAQASLLDKGGDRGASAFPTFRAESSYCIRPRTATPASKSGCRARRFGGHRTRWQRCSRRASRT